MNLPKAPQLWAKKQKAVPMIMRIAKVLILAGAIASAANAGQQLQTNISVKELPPEPFPVGTCKEDLASYLGTTKGSKENTRLTDRQIGEYVRVRLSQGYSVSLYPQISGNIFAIATCESPKP
jgi:hypothetical protein